MAPKKAPTEEQAILGGSDAELDQAIDDLRGVLQKDASVGTKDVDFGMDFPATTETPDFSSSFGSDDSLGNFGGDFAASSFGESSFSETTDFGSDDAFSGQMTAEPGSNMNSNLDLIMDIPIDVQIVLGTSRMQVSGLMNLTEGATIALDRKIGEPVEIVVNGRMIGRGEITVLDEDDTRFGVKLIEIMSTSKA
jgi:flagellar motor switch protein FliN